MTWERFGEFRWHETSIVGFQVSPTRARTSDVPSRCWTSSVDVARESFDICPATTFRHSCLPSSRCKSDRLHPPVSYTVNIVKSS